MFSLGINSIYIFVTALALLPEEMPVF